MNKEIENKTEFAKSALIYLKDRKLLVARSHGYSVFFLPGGGIKHSESLTDALTREIKEELAVKLENGSIKYLVSVTAPLYEDPNKHIVMHCFFAQLSGDPKPSSEIEELNWFQYSDRDRTSPADNAVFEFLKQQDLID